MEILAISLSGISVVYLIIFLAHHFGKEWWELQRDKRNRMKQL